MISRHLWPILLSLAALAVHACRVSRSQLAGIGSLTAVALGAAALSGLTGCSVAGPRQSPLPHDGPTMVEIYRQHMSEEGAPSRAPSATGVDGGASGARLNDVLGPEREDVAHDTTNPLTDRFQRLPNPDLVMHVYAHLADGKYPVPGYVTVFPMYESVQYALPGEVAPRYARRPQPAASATRASTEPSGTDLSPVSTNSAKAY
jgi:conjugative transfer region lipoprotein (TIGR03751 family)